MIKVRFVSGPSFNYFLREVLSTFVWWLLNMAPAIGFMFLAAYLMSERHWFFSLLSFLAVFYCGVCVRFDVSSKYIKQDKP